MLMSRKMPCARTLLVLCDTCSSYAHINRIQRLARRHEQSIPFGTTEAHVSTDFR